MTRRDKDLNRILDARYDSNIDFETVVRVLLRLGYTVRVRGSHHSFRKTGVPAAITLVAHGRQASGYQIRQVRRVILAFEVLEPEE